MARTTIVSLSAARLAACLAVALGLAAACPAGEEKPVPRKATLEAEWRAYARMKGASTDIIDRNLHITSLAFSGKEVTDKDFAELKNLQHLRRLEVKDVDPEKVTDAAFAHVGALPRLEALVVNGVEITDDACTHIGKLAGLRILEAGGTRISDEGMKALRKLVKLEELDLAGTSVGGEGLAEIAGAKGLARLDLRGTKLRTEDLKAVGRFTALRVLHLPEVAPWGEPNPHPVYQHDGGPRPGFGAEEPKYRPLKAGSISYTDGLKHLSGLASLEKVSMTNVFREAPERRMVYSSKAEDAPLTDLGSVKPFFVTFLEPKPPGEVLRRLGIKRNAKGLLVKVGDRFEQKPLGGEFGAFLARPSGALLQHLRLYKNVTSLDLSGFMVLDDDLKHLAKHEGLARLDLAGSPITAAGLAHLKKLPRLRYLNLRGADIGDRDLKALREMKGLRDVVISQTRVTEKGVEDFRWGPVRYVFDPKQKRPWWCEIDWRDVAEGIPAVDPK